ncbi:MFS transporter [Paraburkholderia phenoliruptrix]|uniref:MFS transporter, MHS family, proline/betaine transporter n=2 Tax=Paraburkholderia phenoliruptrix TaxID=252970 RepID=K0DV58_9BURK|nr:MFS transporter [Paraburkholderia phenoliruptrix]AFT87848.1 MFS transporter, MHS family, proline/betaine transporter [Paraburkholderia phenoliruptrix BR3459a]MDR6418083.1 MHS family proline/betaine transporter-like MFS transporter [Paraburkholderia phenoliruptrix]CAB4046753.1 Proline/betaine transporter [Paraburkholderia phenoliruptrix]
MHTAATVTDTASIETRRSSFYRIILAASIGNALEWFDILIYGFFATIIAKTFFPASNSTVSLLITLGTFGISYLVRPLGALVLGSYADRRGRKASMMVSIVMMMLGTALIALMPGYATMGIAAPIAVVCARMVQGFSAGGEFGSTTAFMVEQAPERKGFIASFQFASQGLSYLLAAGFGVILTNTLETAALESWGWRLPFLFGILIGPVGLYLRKHVHEGQNFQEARSEEHPVSTVFARQKGRMLLAIGTLVVSTGTSYVILYIPTYAVRQLHLPESFGFMAAMLTGAILTFVTPFVGHLSDRVGRVRLMAWAGIVFTLTIYPVFAVLGEHAGLGALMATMAWVGLLKAVYFGALPALMAETFPIETRATGMAISYNVGVTIFGGFAPLIVASLIQATGSKLAPAYYLMLLGVISLIALWRCRKTLNLR